MIDAVMQNIEVVETGLYGVGALGGLWLVFKAFVKKSVTERAEVSIYELQSREIQRLSDLVVNSQNAMLTLSEKVSQLEIAQAQEALQCSARIKELEYKIETLNHQASLQAMIDQAGRDGKIERRTNVRTT